MRVLPVAGNQSGFTLLEVVVALTLMSMVMLATVSGMRTLANTQHTLEQVVSRIDEVRSVSSFLRDHFETAVVGAAGAGALSLGGSLSERSYFEGLDGSVAWKAPVLFGEGYGGVHLLKVERDARRVVLRWQRQDESKRFIDWTDTPSRTLVNNVDEFAINFRGGLEEDWVASWKGKENPAFVRFQIRSQGRRWADLVMPVQK